MTAYGATLTAHDLGPELEVVLTYLRRTKGEASALDIARATSISTLVVIPVLQSLLEQGMVSRRAVPGPATGPSWAYKPTVRGSRGAASGASDS